MISQFFSLRVSSVAIVLAAGLALALPPGNADAAAKGQVVAKSKSAEPHATIIGGGVLQTVFVYSEPNSTQGSSDTFQTLPGMSATITVPGDKSKLVLATFGAESACYGGDAGSPDWCVVGIRANGTVLQPCSGGCADYAFTATDRGNATDGSWRQHQVTRGALLAPGIYTVKVVGRVNRAGTTIPTFWTGERTLTVQVMDN